MKYNLYLKIPAQKLVFFLDKIQKHLKYLFNQRSFKFNKNILLKQYLKNL